MFPVSFQKPAQCLQRYVQFYTQRELSVRDPLFVHPVPARAAPMLEFIFGDRFKVLYAGSSVEETTPGAVVVGMQTRPHAQLRLQGTFQSFVIMFQPTGLDALFPIALNELTGHVYDAHSVLGRPIRELEERLGECQSFQSRVRAADDLLARRIPATSRADRLATVVHFIDANKGRVRIPDLAASAGIGQRQFEREFGTRFGMRPKLYARVVRFQATIDSKARSAAKSWTDVAHEFGYHDQMHLIHDFEEFTAGTPTENLRVLEAFFREQIELIRIGMGAKDPRLVPRFVI
ncbi:MAG TPA: helix-turn-helix domain-containing protein [Terracidiphilus sp.]|jgi:AraC-like DNA-binding protein|nr:helix-turn-helix domain-containing protein [Terracidiphilus sp.]